MNTFLNHSVFVNEGLVGTAVKAVGSNRETGAQVGMRSNHQGETGDQQVYNPVNKGLVLNSGPLCKNFR